MSKSLHINNLRPEIARFGTNPYLLTQGDDGRPHAVAVTIEWHGDSFVTSTGKQSTANVAAHPLLSLLWPPFEDGGYSLIVDGDGCVIGSGSDSRISVTPTRGVLHRPGPPHRLHVGAARIAFHCLAEGSIKLVEILMQFRLCLRKEYSRICHFVSLLPGTA